MMNIIELKEKPELLMDAVSYFWKNWGSDSNYNFYRDCIEKSCQTESDIPRFYIALEDGNIVGSYALLRSDLNSRQDLHPWFACLYVRPEYRKNGLGTRLQNHAIKEAKDKGYKSLYLCTDLADYYEKNGWEYVGTGYSISDEETKIYEYQIVKP
ncbi:GNAT family N-acetyltransferase [Paenibacillus sp. KN14-4R]|uniref:GNAT family N-acetyltransferase n=1 Tax=Paenibacillus sp. KN14-4R TaxID=3445773 RepID=UPI003F9F0E69